MKVLIIEDCRVHLNLLQRLLGKAKGVEPIGALDALEGFAILRTIPDIEVVVIDQNLPYLKGIDFIAKLKATPPFDQVPIFISSGEEMSNDFLAAGADEVMIKPYDVALFVQAFEKYRKA